MQAGGSGGPRASRIPGSSQISGGPNRQSGAPAPGAQAPYDPTGLGLPDLSGRTPRLTPRVSPSNQPPFAQSGVTGAPVQSGQTGQPHTLGIGRQLARTRSTGSPSLPSPAPGATLTQQMRAIAPPDVARQTLDEQKLLAHELLALPEALETSGLAKTHERSYLEAVRAYVDLADDTWIAIAEERLEQSGAEQTHRQSAIAIARRVKRMQNESQLAASNTQFPLPRKRPFFWRRRLRLQREGLRAWQAHLGMPADPYVMGAALAHLRGATALAGASNLELFLWDLFAALVGDVMMVLWLGFIIALIAALALGDFATIGVMALAATATLAGRVLLAYLLRRGPARLDYLFARSVFSPLRSPRAGVAGSRVIAVLLRAWGIVTTLVGLLGMAAALGYSVWQLLGQPITQPTTALDWVRLVGSLIVNTMWLPTEAGLAAVGALALPVLLVTALRFMGELGGNMGWVRAARRYALAPALHALAFLAAGSVAALAALAPYLGLRRVALASVTVGQMTQSLTLQTVALVVIPALVLLVGLDIPYRVGILRWRRHWLDELTTRRADIDSDVRRRSAVDPRTGMQDTSDENLRAMEYDMMLVQFYTTRTEEARRVSSAPYGWLAGVGVVILLVVVALLVDGLAQQFAHLLLNVG